MYYISVTSKKKHIIKSFKDIKSKDKGNITHLHIGNINTIPNFNGFDNLKHLIINNINSNKKLSFSYSLINLESLYIYESDISTLDISYLINLKDLACLYTNINKIKGLENCKELEILNLPFNKLITLDNINNLTKLKLLICDSNKLCEFPDISKLKKLEILNCSNNPICEIPKDVFYNLSNLKKLIIAKTKIKQLDDNLFIGLNNLISLHLNINNLKNIPSSINYCTNLKILNIADNYISHSNFPKDLSNLTKLKTLNINYNEFKKIPSSILHCKNLKHFIYIENPIKRIPININNFLKSLTINNNNLKVFNDSENVHDSNIQKDIITSFNNILSISKNIDDDYINYILLKSNSFTKEGIKVINNLRKDTNTKHCILNITFDHAFKHIIHYIIHYINDSKNEIFTIINNELINNKNTCFMGQFTRLITSLAGFTNLVSIGLPENVQILNKIIILKKQYFMNNQSHDIQTLKDFIKNNLTEYSQDLVNEYVEYIEI